MRLLDDIVAGYQRTSDWYDYTIKAVADCERLTLQSVDWEHICRPTYESRASALGATVYHIVHPVRYGIADIVGKRLCAKHLALMTDALSNGKPTAQLESKI
jgi:hypothetical protein